MSNGVRKKFMGSWIVFVILLIFCWPIALVYFFSEREYEFPNPPPYQAYPQYQQPYPPPPGYPPQYQQPYQQPYEQPPQGGGQPRDENDTAYDDDYYYS